MSEGCSRRLAITDLDVLVMGLYSLYALRFGAQAVEVIRQAFLQGSVTKRMLTGGRSQRVVATQSKAVSLLNISLDRKASN